MPPRVAFLHGSNDIYGASRVLVDDVRVLQSLGWRVDVVLPEDGPLIDLLAGVGVEVYVQTLSVLRRVAMRKARIPLTLPANAESADLVVLWTLALASYMPTLALRKKPTICSVHEILPGALGTLLGATVGRLAGGIMANSTATAKWLRKCGGVRTLPIVAYPVAPKYSPLASPSPDGPLHVLVAGRVNGQKGHIEAVSACRLARSAGVDLRLTLLGAPFPGQEAHLDSLLVAIDGESWIQYPGEVSSIRPFLADAHVMLIPSTTPEPFGVVALEAWSAGRLVVAADTGGLSEAADLVGGLKFAPCDVHAIARILLEIGRGRAIIQPADSSAPVARLCSLAQRELAWRELLTTVVPDQAARAERDEYARSRALEVTSGHGNEVRG
jgi:glycosyltransferase involved in cell wall biosynthesis